jgi:hypothetical protein
MIKFDFQIRQIELISNYLQMENFISLYNQTLI